MISIIYCSEGCCYLLFGWSCSFYDRLSFAARTKELVSGGLPEVVVLSDFEGQVIAAADLPQGTNSWQSYTLEFTAPATKEVVYLVIRRKSCPVLSCPAFGRT